MLRRCLRRGRPQCGHRELFLRARRPSGPLKHTALDAPIRDFLAHRRMLGRGYVQEEYILRGVRNFFLKVGADDLDRTTFNRWCEHLKGVSANTRRARQQALLCNRSRGWRPYTGTGLCYGIAQLFERAGVRDEQGRRPCIHDLRHSFAVQALTRFYSHGEAVRSRLPHLALYMGHVSIVSTAYYLHFVPTLAALASERFAQQCGHVIDEVPHGPA